MTTLRPPKYIVAVLDEIILPEEVRSLWQRFFGDAPCSIVWQ